MCSEILTKEECETVLKNSLDNNDFRLIDYKIVSFSKNVNGFLGEYFKLDIEFIVENVKNNLSYFIKRKPDTGKNQNIITEFINETNAFNKELFFYQQIISDEKVEWAPEYYFSKTNELIVLNDLIIKGYEPPSRINELDMNHCQVALKTIAQFHAFCITYEQKKSVQLGKPYSSIDEFPNAFREVLFGDDPNCLGYAWFSTGLRCFHTFIDQYPNTNTMSRDTFKKLFDRKFHESREHVRPSKQYFNTISHGDIWSNNLLFKTKNGKAEHCYLIDYQLIRYNPPANDVLMFIMLNTSLEFHNQHLPELLMYYYRQLHEELNRNNINCSQIIPWEEFEKSCKQFSTTWKLVRFAYLSVHLLDDEIIEDVLKDMGKYKDMMFFNREKVLLDIFKKDIKYREKIIEMMDDIRDTLSINILNKIDCVRILKEKRNSIKNKDRK